MLFKQKILDGIVAGKVSVAFRRWNKPAAKAGSLLKTSVGVLKIIRVDRVGESALSERAARMAGYETLGALRKELDARPGTLYRISLTYAGADPRIKLRNSVKLSAAELATLKLKLGRLDKFSAHGNWVKRVLKAIEKYPDRPAIQLSQKLGLPKEWLKLNIRKLKNLGLTKSLNPGYRLSPRGRAAMPHI